MYSEDKLSEQNLLEGDASEEEKDEESNQSISRLTLSQHYGVPTFIWGLQLIFFLVSLSLLLSSFSHCSSQAGVCKDHMPMYSPALEGVKNTGFYRRFNGSFSKPNDFKGPPSPSIDEHWQNITYSNGIVLFPFMFYGANNRRRCD
jgi:hypothetical protein